MTDRAIAEKMVEGKSDYGVYRSVRGNILIQRKAIGLHEAHLVVGKVIAGKVMFFDDRAEKDLKKS